MSRGPGKAWQRLDPRRHLGVAIGWIVFIVVTSFAVGAGLFAAAKAEDQVRADSERLLSQFATGVARALAIDLGGQRSLLRATAARITAADALGSGAALQRQLDAAAEESAAFAWLGVADAGGRLLATTGGLPPGPALTAWPSFQRVFQPTRATPETGQAGQTGKAGNAAIELSVPIIDPAGRVSAALFALLSSHGFERLHNEPMLAQAKSDHAARQWFLVAPDGTLLEGPPAWRGRRLAVGFDLSEGSAYLVGRAVADLGLAGAGDWTVLVRQRSDLALARTDAVGRTVFLTVLSAGLLSAALAMGFLRLPMRRLTRLAKQARSLQQGASTPLTVPAGRDEISHVGAVLVELVAQLQREKQTLQQLNAELDRRVAERSARIEQLADDARHAAVTRERLRIARDLHDTLAHSLMALLTQIRLVRKLRARWAEHELDAELASAEAVAASGLAEARGAIAQIRQHGVREAGLGPALQALLARFRERTGLAATLQIDPAAGTLADERAETTFRIAEEALRNVERHAQAQTVRIRVASCALPAAANAAAAEAGHTQRVRLEVADDGIGFDPAARPHGHYGLRGMQEQAALIGAQLELVCAPGQGARIVLAFDA